jgi:acylpyruvate hydrolase
MKIIAVGRNYAAHAKEFNNEVPDAPIIFLKPETSLLRHKMPFYLPAFSNEIHHEIELVLKINKEGKHISEQFADRYYDEIGLGIDFTARDIQQSCKEKGLPWELAKAFDHSSPIGEFVAKDSLPDLQNINFHLSLNEKVVQTGATQNLLFTFSAVISFVSRYITLKKGDLIFTGTPEGAGPVAIGDRLQGYLEGIKLLDFEIK